jgi:hypothetical protein
MNEVVLTQWQVHSVTHLKIMITARSSEMVEGESIQCAECDEVKTINCLTAMDQISRDIDEVIKAYVLAIATSEKFKQNFAKASESGDSEWWSYICGQLGQLRFPDDVIEEHKDFIVFWVKTATESKFLEENQPRINKSSSLDDIKVQVREESALHSAGDPELIATGKAECSEQSEEQEPESQPAVSEPPPERSTQPPTPRIRRQSNVQETGTISKMFVYLRRERRSLLG